MYRGWHVHLSELVPKWIDLGANSIRRLGANYLQLAKNEAKVNTELGAAGFGPCGPKLGPNILIESLLIYWFHTLLAGCPGRKG